MQALHRLRRRVTVGQLVIGLRAHFEGRALHALALRDALVGVRIVVVLRLILVAILLHALAVILFDLLRPIHWIGVDGLAGRIPVRFAPRAAIFKTMMEDLAQRRAVVAVRLEVLRQCDRIRQRDAEVRLQIPHLRRIGPPPGEQR